MKDLFLYLAETHVVQVCTAFGGSTDDLAAIPLLENPREKIDCRFRSSSCIRLLVFFQKTLHLVPQLKWYDWSFFSEVTIFPPHKSVLILKFWKLVPCILKEIKSSQFFT